MARRKREEALGFIPMDRDADPLLIVLHKRAEKRMHDEALSLLEWSRSLEEHCLPYEVWKMQRVIASRMNP